MWRTYDKEIKKNRIRRPDKRWRDDMYIDKYLRDTVWQRTGQDRLTWRRHAETFPNPNTLWLPNDDDGDDDDDDDDDDDVITFMHLAPLLASSSLGIHFELSI